MGAGLRGVAARIYDMLKAIESIEAINTQKREVNGLAPWIARLAIERAIEIISEASRHIPTEMKTDFPDIRWKNIAGIGNILRHDYQSIRDSVIGNITVDEIPILKAALQTMQDRLDDGQNPTEQS
jgi:uncharacterized protein with HEPN domain